MIIQILNTNFHGTFSIVIERLHELRAVRRWLRDFPVVGLLGARQVGKTTLARAIAAEWRGGHHYFDLENTNDLAALTDAHATLTPLKGLIVIDEVQRRPELFPALRVLADRKDRTRFLLLGSAAPELLRQSSESLAGRIAYHELGPLSLQETGEGKLDALWLRGGFPLSFTARNDAASQAWRQQFIRTFVERDLVALQPRVSSGALTRFWAMLSHVHGQTLNLSELGRSLGVNDGTVRSYLDLLTGTFVTRQLKAWFENISKRQVKAPKVYVSDSGLLHALLDIETRAQLHRHPKLGASWEGFCIEQVVHQLQARPDQCFYWATHNGAELDLLIVKGGKRYGFEMKHSDAPTLTPSMRIAQETLKLDSLDVIYPGTRTYSLARGIRALPLSDLLAEYPLR